MIFSIKNVLFSGKLREFNVILRTASKIAVELHDGILRKIENNELHPRRHPGVMKSSRVDLPLQIRKALEKVVGDYPVKKLLEDCKKLNTLISSRHPPPEQDEQDKKLGIIVKEAEKLIPHVQPNSLSESEQIKLQNRKEKFIKKRMRERTFAWKPIVYGHYESLVYAIGRGAREYSILLKILQEIKARDVGFNPQSYIDFGSGVGTGMWAASDLWKESIVEYFNVDSSRDMNELSELILREGNENQQMTLKNVFYRQFLPGLETKFDLVISAFSLFELPNAESRLDTIMNLWKKCDGYMVIVEEGTRRGFELINEAKDLILSQEKHNLVGHIFAPCPHDDTCPRILNAEDRTPCNFEVTFTPTSLGNTATQNLTTTRYSYVVLKKELPDDPSRTWPRLVRPTLVRSKHSICRMCTSEGKLAEIIFTQSKHGRTAYRCARASRWGDRLPITIGETVEN